jgi:hypothetical protein
LVQLDGEVHDEGQHAGQQGEAGDVPEVRAEPDQQRVADHRERANDGAQQQEFEQQAVLACLFDPGSPVVGHRADGLHCLIAGGRDAVVAGLEVGQRGAQRDHQVVRLLIRVAIAQRRPLVVHDPRGVLPHERPDVAPIRLGDGGHLPVDLGETGRLRRGTRLGDVRLGPGDHRVERQHHDEQRVEHTTDEADRLGVVGARPGALAAPGQHGRRRDREHRRADQEEHVTGHPDMIDTAWRSVPDGARGMYREE